jgi:PAS domain-containing protein
MSQDFTTRLQLELRAAAERQEQRSALGRLREQLPRPSVLAIAAAAAAVLLALVLAGGLGWHHEETITAPRVTKTLPLADNLGSIAAGFGAVWVSDPATPQVLRLDPATRKVTARVPAMDKPILNTGAGAVWVVGFVDDVVKPETLLKIDPDTARVVARTRLRVGGRPFVAGDVQIVGDQVWVIGRDGVLRIDPGTGRIAQHFFFAQREGDPFPQAAWATPDGIVALRREGRIERYDPHTGRLNGLLPVRLADSRILVPTDAGPVLLTGHGRIALAEPRRGAIVWDRQLPGTAAWPFVDGRRLWTWVSESDGDWMYELDLRTGALKSRTRLPEFGAAGIVRVGRELWVTSQNGKLMIVETPPEQGG